MNSNDYALPVMKESEIQQLEEKIYRQLCGNALTGEVAAWLSIFHSHFVRLSNRVAELEHLLKESAS